MPHIFNRIMTTDHFVTHSDRRPLLTAAGRAWYGLEHSRFHELNERVPALFEHLHTRMGFADNNEGRRRQERFNWILRYAYPEILIDLADLVYVQHERPMVFLNFDQLRDNWTRDPERIGTDPAEYHRELDDLFLEFAEAVKQHWREDAEVVRLLAEGYSYYLWHTRNFPWEDPLKDTLPPGGGRVLDVATGLAGFSLIHDWPEDYPTLVLSDAMPFIVAGLTHYLRLTGKRNVDILTLDFPNADTEYRFDRIHVSKFLHHLPRADRREFLSWAKAHLEPGGLLSVIDTDLEWRILKDSENPEYRAKLMPGYLETLVPVEDKFCHNLVEDIRALGFAVREFDFHEYYDETDAYSHYPGDTLPLQFLGFEIVAENPA